MGSTVLSRHLSSRNLLDIHVMSAAYDKYVEKKIKAIDMLFAYWMRTMVKDEHKFYGDLLTMVHRFHHHPPEERVDLVVEKHRGHVDLVVVEEHDYHPNDLLDETWNTSYCSKYGSPSSDWIVFKQKEQRGLVSTKIMIRNEYVTLDRNIKSIAIQWSEDGVEYQDLIRIDEIKAGDAELQWFEVNAEQSGLMKFIKLNILDNYGNPNYNMFCEFGVFGVLE